jgi:glyoxylase-like metal-dependent hydrolase (beta-lactamase superfamily II)
MLIGLLCLPFALGAAPDGVPREPAAPTWHVVAGGFTPGRGPDGNSVFLDAPEGLVLIDTGRHRVHQERLLDYARKRGRPIAAIVNTHWHLDHSGGNAEIRAAFPEAPLYASSAIEGALTGFFVESRLRVAEYLDSGKASAEQRVEIAGDLAAMDDTASLRPTVAVTRSGNMTIAGRSLTVNLAPYAATEGDVWIFDPNEKLIVAGDLVVAMVPFMDTACADGWRDALDAIGEVPFETLIPGHGEPMSRLQFGRWHDSFDNLLDCAASDATRDACIAGWRRDAAEFIPADETRVDEMVGYYIDTRLRAEPAERLRYCET